MYRVKYTNRARKAIEKIDKHTAKLLLAWIRKNLEGCSDPYRWGRALVGKSVSGKWRYRIGQYRLLVYICKQDLTIVILDIGHRKEIYR
ncbi:plasmid stabilization system protein [Clostridia bacterium]|nr:plasmid stabilization system protein [Clostridia bacterium]